MTTAHRPTFDPARGRDNSQMQGSIVHTRMLPAHAKLKFRQKGQGGAADSFADRDFKAELLLAEQAANEEKRKHLPDERVAQIKRLEAAPEDESLEAKKRRILEETRDIDASDDSSDDDGVGGSGSDDDSSDGDSEDEDEDETALLMKELEKIKREKALEKQRKEKQEAEMERKERERQIAYSNPLMNPESSGFQVQRDWTEDTVFRNQAKGASNGNQLSVINDLIRSDFHRKFMDKYVK